MISEQINLASMLPVIEKVLDSGGEFTFIPNGRSMLPMLVGGKDSVSIVKPHGRLKKFELPLYRRENGAFVMHRVIKVLPDSYVMRGDSQYQSEPGIKDGQIVGVLKSFTKFGKTVKAGSLLYRLYCILWQIYPLKRFVLHFVMKKV